MAWLIVGTIPHRGFPLVESKCNVVNGRLRLGDHSLPVSRGTPALLATACLTAELLGIDPPMALLCGDIGRGDGSRKIYEHLVREIPLRPKELFVFHYLQPDVDWHNRILCTLEDLSAKPTLIADAGYMYVAKMSGFAASYDLFTPDAGEVAFLADESAPHPFYTRGFLLQEDDRVPELIRRAYQHENAARYLLVKGRCDFVASEAGISAKICDPAVEAMEPIGGTGDSLTGIASALVRSGRSIPEASVQAAYVNRLLGLICNPTPAFSVAELLPALPRALEMVLPESNHIS